MKSDYGLPFKIMIIYLGLFSIFMIYNIASLSVDVAKQPERLVARNVEKISAYNHRYMSRQLKVFRDKKLEQEKLKLVEEEKAKIETLAYEIKEEDYEIYEVTAYTAGYESTGKTKDHPEYGITASGKRVQEGKTIAADWDVHPVGTRIEIKGLGEFVVEDKGSAIKGKRLDVYIEDLDEALKFGRQKMEVRVIK